MPTPAEMFEWLEAIAAEGACPALLNDDNGHWAVAFDGMQNVPSGDAAQDISTSFFVSKRWWKDSIAEAIDYAMTHESE